MLRLGISAKLYSVVGLLLVALAAQAIGTLHLADQLVQVIDQAFHPGLTGSARAERIQTDVARHRTLVEAAMAAEKPQDVEARLSAHRAGIAELRELLHEETRAPDGHSPELRRIIYNLPEFDLAGEAVLQQALRQSAYTHDGGPIAFDSTALPRALRVFAVAAARMAEDTDIWRRDRRDMADTAAHQLDRSVGSVGNWAVLSGVIAFTLGLIGIGLMRGVAHRLSGITDSILRLARHEPDVAIPALAEPGPIGEVARAVAVFRDDLRELDRRGEARERAVAQLDAALNNMTQGLVMVGPDGRLQLWNRRFVEILNLPIEQMRTGMPVREVLALSLAAGNYPGENLDTVLARVLRQFSPESPDRGFVIPLGSGPLVQVAWEPMPGGGWLATYDDITESRRNEARLVHLARHDALTDLANRPVLREAIGRAAAQARRGAPFAVLAINLDRFKPVNDSLGHDAGDAVLRQVAERLRQHVRAIDTVGRLGADDFVVVQVGTDQPSSAVALANRLIEVLSQPYAMDGGLAVVGASVGIALADTVDVDADGLLRNAELAQQRAKEEGGSVVRFFAPEMDARAQERRVLELDLRQALVRNEFELFYQPLISVQDRRICAFEALLRWRHPERGLVRPDLFIPLAEEVGLIIPIGAWALRRACAEAASWPSDIRVAVNLSSVQFGREGLVDQVEQALAASGLAATRLELEITESVLLGDDAATLDILHQLRSLGVRISMDDFGTGYSSLSYLRSFPFDKIKIDKSFIQGLDGSEGSEAIVRAIAGLGHSLGIATTAEGVETVHQLTTLVADGCTEMQGFLFSPPRPASDVPLLISASKTWPGMSRATAQPA